MFDKNNCNSEMQITTNAFSNELKNIRTGRVSPDILKTIVVDSYGSKTPLTQLSNINNLDNMTLNINVWDSSLLKIIEKSGIDLNEFKSWTEKARELDEAQKKIKNLEELVLKRLVNYNDQDF